MLYNRIGNGKKDAATPTADLLAPTRHRQKNGQDLWAANKAGKKTLKSAVDKALAASALDNTMRPAFHQSLKKELFGALPKSEKSYWKKEAKKLYEEEMEDNLENIYE